LQLPPGGTIPTARRTLFQEPRFSRFRLAETFRRQAPLAPDSLLPRYRLADLALSPGVVSVLMQYWSRSGTLRTLISHPSTTLYTSNSAHDTA